MASSVAQFAITTTFTPPPACTQDHLTLLPSSLSYFIYLNYPDPVPETTVTSCYPSQFISSYFSQQAVATPIAAIEPFICPVGYAEVTALPSVSGYLACCPSGFLLHQQDSPIDTRPAFGGTCYSDISTVVVTAYGDSSVTATSTYVGATGAQAYGLVMEGYATAAPSSAAATTTRSTSSFASSATAAADSSSHSTSHTGAIAGGVVGGLAGIALVLSLVFFLHKRRRRSQSQRDALNSGEIKEGVYGDKIARNNYPNDEKSLPGRKTAEMGGSHSYASEKDASTAVPAVPAAELDTRPRPVHQLSELDGSESEVRPSA